MFARLHKSAQSPVRLVFGKESGWSSLHPTRILTPPPPPLGTQAPGASRDLLLLDLALDGWFRTSVEKVDKSAMSGDDLVELACLVLSNAAIAVSILG